jgi:hypothetical protein
MLIVDGSSICPGILLAQASVFLACATVLATFNIRKSKDADGMEIEPVVDYSSGTIRSARINDTRMVYHSTTGSHPKEFSCDIVPRSLTAEAIVRATTL